MPGSPTRACGIRSPSTWPPAGAWSPATCAASAAPRCRRGRLQRRRPPAMLDDLRSSAPRSWARRSAAGSRCSWRPRRPSASPGWPCWPRPTAIATNPSGRREIVAFREEGGRAARGRRHRGRGGARPARLEAAPRRCATSSAEMTRDAFVFQQGVEAQERAAGRRPGSHRGARPWWSGRQGADAGLRPHRRPLRGRGSTAPSARWASTPGTSSPSSARRRPPSSCRPWLERVSP